MTTTAPYFTAKAREIFADAGGDPDNSGPLAAWAEAARPSNDTTRGVLVAADGTILGATERTRLAGATYMVEADAARWGMLAPEVGIARATLRRITGQPVVHVTFSAVCLGAGAYVREV